MMQPAERVPIESVHHGQSPRFVAEDADRVRRLAETEDELPPLVVHRQNLTAVDGIHRLRAELLKNQCQIAVEFFDRAAEHVISGRSEMSDRAVAAATGLSAKTVAAVRRHPTEDGPQSSIRIGQDGGSRPVSAEDGRKRALEVICERPAALPRDLSLRFSESGRTRLTWLGSRVVTLGGVGLQVGDAQAHPLPVIADLAMECADEWRQSALRLERTTRQSVT
jgi:hypothetical protein